MTGVELFDRTLAILRSAGQPVIERPGWRGRGTRHPFTPVAPLNHHDVLNAGVSTARGLELMEKGRPDLNGPLANWWVEDDGVLYLVAGGNANHAGRGASQLLDRVRRDLPPAGDAVALGYGNDIVGNTWYVGIEWHNAGDGRDPYEGPQLTAGLRLNAALCLAGSWSHNRAAHHRQHTARKIDMSLHGPLNDWVGIHMLDLAGWPKAPTAPPAPPSWRVTDDWQEDPVKRIDLVIPRLDDTGRGHVLLNGKGGLPDVPFGRLVSVRPHGSNPARDGYWPIPETAEQNDGGKTRLTIEGGRPAGECRLFLTVAS